jgi:hypothetical protein
MTITIPPQLVGHAPSGAYQTLGHAAEAISRMTERRESRPERYREPLGALDRARALLDAIGWQDAVAQLDESHAGALSEALADRSVNGVVEANEDAVEVKGRLLEVALLNARIAEDQLADRVRVHPQERELSGATVGAEAR